jgi:hypothetical protein
VLKNLIQASGIITHPIPLHDAEVFISEVDPEFAREMGWVEDPEFDQESEEAETDRTDGTETVEQTERV